MKRMIISPAQLKAINEAEQRITAQSAGGADILNAVTNANIDPNTSVKVAVPGNPSGKDYSTTMDALRAGDNIPPTAKNVYVDPAANGNVAESRYTKRQVELGRMLEMRRTGKVYSKKQLNEMFMENQENVERLKNGIGTCMVFDIFDAVDEAFGPEYGEEMNSGIKQGGDPMTVLNDIFSRQDSDKQEEFLDILGI